MLRSLVSKCGVAAGLLMAASAQAQVTLWDNGGFVTGIGNGTGGVNTSAIDADRNVFGFGAGAPQGNAPGNNLANADNFAVPASQTWTLTRSKWYAYQTGSTTTAVTITAAFVTVYSGKPGAPGTTVLFGDYVTNRITGATVSAPTPESSQTQVARVTNADPTPVNRMIQEVVIDMTGCPPLSNGEFWIGVAFQGALNSGPWMVPVSPNRVGDDAVQTPNVTDPNNINLPTQVWNLINGAAGGTAGTPGGEQDYPFKLIGTSVTGAPGTPPSSTPLTIPGDGSFSSLTQAVAAGQTKWFSFTLASALAADEALDIDTEGTTLDEVSIALYDSEGLRKAVDRDNGSGPNAMLSFGTGLRAPTGTGASYNGRNGTTLAAGTYYLAVTGGNTASAYSLGGWSVANTSTNTGNVTVRIRKATGQTPPVAPAAIDLGLLATNGTFATQSTTLALGEVKWFKFTLPAALPAATSGALDVDMEGSALGPNNDASFALYGNNGALIATSLQEGSGDLPMLSFGATFATSIRPKASLTGYNYNGRNGIGLGAATFYLAVLGGDRGTFAGNNWDVVPGPLATEGNTGNITVRARFYNAASLPTTFPTPTPVHDFGLIADDNTNFTVSPDLALAKEGVVWVKFKLPANVQLGSSFLDIDTEGSNLAPANDTFIIIYSGFTGGVPTHTLGNRPGAAQGMAQSGDGENGSGQLSQLTFGSGHRQAVARSSRFSGRNGNGTAILGADPTNTVPNQGEYYMAVFGGGFGQANANRFDASSASVNAGTVKVRIRFSTTVPPVQPPVLSYSLGAISSAADTAITTGIAPADVIWVKFTLSEDVPGTGGDKYLDIDTFGTTDPTNNQGDTYIALYDSNGFRLAQSDDEGPGLTSQFSFGAGTRPANGDGAPFDGASGSLTAGDYYLAVSMFDNNTQATLWGASDWNGYSPHIINKASGISIRVRTNLPPAGPVACNAADIATAGNPDPNAGPDGFLTGDDFDLFINAFFNELRRTSDNSLIADLVDGDGNLPADGFLTGSDFDYFLGKFFQGC